MTHRPSTKLSIIILTQAHKANKAGMPYHPGGSFVWSCQTFEADGVLRKGEHGGFWLTERGIKLHKSITHES